MNGHRRNLILRAAVAALMILLIPLAVWLSGRQGDKTVVFSELMAANEAYPDPEGRYRDFVELRNLADRDADLSGWGLTDAARRVKYRFPQGTVIPAGGWLLVWCETGAEDAAPFSLSRAGGETVTLRSARNRVVDRVETLPMARNQSMVPDGAGGWTLSDEPTPGFENSAAGRAAYLRAGEVAGAVVFNEFMSGNSLYPAPDGECRDWLELRNLTDADVDLTGWRLSDTAEKDKYVFPAGTTLPAGGCLALWCGLEGIDFALARAGGETLCLTDAQGRRCDRVETPALEKNRSWARDGDGTWAVSETPTPGYENSEAGWERYLADLGYGDCQVVLSEAMADNRGCLLDGNGRFSDWVELWNAGDTAADLTGWYLSDDPGDPGKWRIPALTIPAGGYALIFCDGLDADVDGELHAGFSLSASGETLTLSTPVGSPVSRLSFGALGPDRSALGLGDATEPSPGQPNTPEGVLAAQCARKTPFPLVINEVMSANDFYLRQYAGGYYDWVELKNVSGETVELAGYGLSDDAEAPDAFRFSEGTLAPGETAVVLLTGGEGTPYLRLPAAPFALNAREDWLYLFTPAGEVLDFLHVTEHPYRGSLGRMDGARGFFRFETATPGQDNADGRRGVAPAPTAEAAPGVYEGVDSVTVALSGPGEIRCTTDGSVPTAGSPLYTEPLTLTETGVVRARCFVPGLVPGPTATFNYVINAGHSLPVVCLSMAPADFDGPEGIYTQAGSHFEVSANLTLFEPEGGGFSRDCAAKLHGAGSRTHYAKKYFKINFRPRYGGALDYDLFGDGYITGYDSLLLRGGGLMNGNVLLKDPMIALAAERCGAAALYLRARFAVLYINGRYWGIYGIRDAYSERYVADRLGGREEDVTIVQGPVSPGFAPNIQDLYARISSPKGDLAWAEAWLDVDSLIDWMILEAYFTNQDISGNIRYIQGGEDGLWRYGLFDLDESLYDDAPNWSFVTNRQEGSVPKALLQSPEFRERLLGRLSELLAGPLSREAMGDALEEIIRLLEPEMDREGERWGGRAAWDASTQRFLASFRGDRGERLARELAKMLRLSDEEFERWFPEIVNSE